MPSYRYLAYTLRTDQLLTELPLAGVRFGKILNRAGAVRASLNLAPRSRTIFRSYLNLPGVADANASSPHAAALNIVGDIDLRWSGRVTDWTPAATSRFLAKAGTSATGGGYSVRLNTDGTLSLQWSDGTSVTAETSTEATGFADGGDGAWRATMDVNDGAGNRVVTFYTATVTDQTNPSDMTWVQLGAPVTTVGVTSIGDATADLAVGTNSNGNQPLAGRCYWVEIRNGINGPIVFRSTFNDRPPGATTITANTGQQVTINPTASIADNGTTTSFDTTLASVFVDATHTGSEGPQRAIYIERDGVLVWGGVWWTRRYDTATHTLELAGAELWSLMARRLITDTKTYLASTHDQTSQIAADLVTYAQSKPGANLGIVNDSPASGVKRDRTYWGYEQKPVAEAIEQLAEVDNGFDFAIDVAYVAGLLTKTFRTSYPRRGRIAGQTGHVWELGRNITSLLWPEDATQAANSVHLLGEGEGDKMLRSSTTRTDLLDAGHPLLEAGLSFKDINVKATLDGHAFAELDARAQAPTLPELAVRADLDPRFSSYITGDEARIIVPTGRDPRFPNGLDTFRRIVAFDVSVPDTGGGEEVTLTLDRPA